MPRLELLCTISVQARELVGMRHNLHTVELPASPLGIIDANRRRYLSERGSRRRLHRRNDATAVPPPLEIAPNRSVDDVCRECKRKSRIRYKYRDALFVPGRFRINHAELGRSKIRSNARWTGGKSTLMRFSLRNMPKSLGMIPARSIYDYNSLNYMRARTEVARRARLFSYRVFGMVPPIPDNDNRNAEDWGV